MEFPHLRNILGVWGESGVDEKTAEIAREFHLSIIEDDPKLISSERELGLPIWAGLERFIWSLQPVLKELNLDSLIALIFVKGLYGVAMYLSRDDVKVGDPFTRSKNTESGGDGYRVESRLTRSIEMLGLLSSEVIKDSRYKEQYWFKIHINKALSSLHEAELVIAAYRKNKIQPARALWALNLLLGGKSDIRLIIELLVKDLEASGIQVNGKHLKTLLERRLYDFESRI